MTNQEAIEWAEDNYQEWLNEEWEKRNGLTDREELEAEALRVCSSESTYNLRDCIGDLSDDELRRVIACNGDYEKESAL